LRSFPDSIRHLTSLEFLKIRGCPTLKERCKKGTGEDWDKIAHIPKLHVDWMQKHSHLKSIDSICLFLYASTTGGLPFVCCFLFTTFLSHLVGSLFHRNPSLDFVSYSIVTIFCTVFAGYETLVSSLWFCSTC